MRQAKYVTREEEIKKRKGKIFQEFIKGKVSEDMQKRINDCGKFLLFNSAKEKRKLGIISCKNRFCPICAYKKSRKDAMKISIIIEEIEKDCKFLFLTLTAKAVTGDNLINEITDYNNSFKRMTELKPYLKLILGYSRKLEITYDRNKTITKEMYKQKKKYFDSLGLKVGTLNPDYEKYHVNFHALLAVKKYFFSSRYYIKQDVWTEMWQKSKRDETGTQVDVKRLDMKNFNKKKAIKILSVFTVKDSDYLKNQKQFDIIYNALKDRQLVTFNGIFKESIKKNKKM